MSFGLTLIPRIRRRPHWRRMTVIGVSAALLLAACGTTGSAITLTSATAPAIPKGPITLCATASESGTYAEVGAGAAKTAELDAAYINNQYGGIDGHKILIDVENDQSDATTTASLTQKFVSEHAANPSRCPIDFSLTQDPLTVPVQAAILDKAGIVSFTTQEIDQYFDPKVYPYIFSLSPPHTTLAKAVVHYLALHNLTKIGVLTDNLSEMTEYVNDVEAANKAMGNKLTFVKSVSISPGAVDVQTQLAQLKAANVQVILTAIEFGFGPVWDGLHTMGWSPNIMGDQGFFYSGYSALGSLGPNAEGLCWLGQIPGQSVPQFVLTELNKIAAQSPTLPDPLIATVYGVGELFLAKYAIEHAHSLNDAALKSELESLRDAPVWWSGLRLTYTPTDHAGLSGAYTAGICRAAPLGKIGNNFPIFVYADSYRPPAPTH